MSVGHGHKRALPRQNQNSKTHSLATGSSSIVPVFPSNNTRITCSLLNTTPSLPTCSSLFQFSPTSSLSLLFTTPATTPTRSALNILARSRTSQSSSYRASVRTCCASRVSVRCVGASSINFAARVRVWSLTREAW